MVPSALGGVAAETGMEILLVIAVLGMALRWYFLRARLQDLERRIEEVTANQTQVRELTSRIFRLEQSFARLLPPAPPRRDPPALTARPAGLALPRGEAFADGPSRVPPALPMPSPFRPPGVPSPPFEPRFTAPTHAGWRERLDAAPGSSEWESTAGASRWIKAGAILLAVGVALSLVYSFDRLAAPGRSVLALASSGAVLAGGVWTDKRARNRVWARGLIGAGWAGLYATSYAIYALPAAQIIHNPLAGSLGPLLVALAMIAYSLRYRTQAVTATAYLAAFGALAATPSPLALAGLVPLAASLLYVSNRAEWNPLALFGLVSTYATCILHLSSNAPLASTQALLLAYWLLFEIFDLLRVDKRVVSGGVAWMAALNAAAFLSLFYTLWMRNAPDLVWLASAYGAALYLATAMTRIVLRPPSSFGPGSGLLARLQLGSYEGAIGVSAVLTGLAIFLRLPGVWASIGVALEAEMLYLAGVRFRAPFLRRCGATAFGFSLARLALGDIHSAQIRILGHTTWSWTLPALFHALLFHVNRFYTSQVLRRPTAIFSSVATGIVAVVLAAEVPGRYLGASWLVVALLLLEVGLHRRLLQFRMQAYTLAATGSLVTAYVYTVSGLPMACSGLAIALAAAYLFALRSRWHGGKIEAFEQGGLSVAASGASTILACVLIWNTVPVPYTGLAWCLLALVLFEAGNLGLPPEMRLMSWPVAALGAEAVVLMHRDGFVRFAARDVWASYLTACLAAWTATAQTVIRPPANLAVAERAAITNILGAFGASSAMAFAWLVLPDPLVSLTWAGLGIAAVEIGLFASLGVFRWSGNAVLAAAAVRALAVDMSHAAGNRISERMLAVVSMVAALHWLAYRNRIYTRFLEYVRRYLVTLRGSGGSSSVSSGIDAGPLE